MQDKILHKVEECYQIAEKFYGRSFERPSKIIFNRSGRIGGWYWHYKRQLMFQLDLAEHHAERFINQTVPHEVAHSVQRVLHPSSKPHGHEWQYIMRRVYNLEPDRCHTYDTSVTKVKKQLRHVYSCNCGKEFKISSTMHNRIQEALRLPEVTYIRNGCRVMRPRYYKICGSCRSTIVLKQEGDINQKRKDDLVRQLTMLQKQFELRSKAA